MIFDVYTRLLPQADQETVEVDGVTYRKKSRLTTILVMGVDHDTQDSYEYRKAGQADFLRLVVLDDADKTVQQLQIDRDTMTPVTVLGFMYYFTFSYQVLFFWAIVFAFITWTMTLSIMNIFREFCETCWADRPLTSIWPWVWTAFPP